MYAPLLTSLFCTGYKLIHPGIFLEGRPSRDIVQNIEYLCIGIAACNRVEQLFQSADRCSGVKSGRALGGYIAHCNGRPEVIHAAVEHYKVKLYTGRCIGKLRIYTIIGKRSATYRNIVTVNTIMFCHLTGPALIVGRLRDGVT